MLIPAHTSKPSDAFGRTTHPGFTLIELITAVVIISILATITTVGFSRQQAGARDRTRAARATLVASALEKYYEQHGEYPSPRALTNNYTGNTGPTVASRLAIKDETVLLMPKASSGITNSLTPTLGSDDALAYSASSTDGDANCQTNADGGCDKFTLSYKKESDGSTVTIDSIHQGRDTAYETPLAAPAKPTLSAVQSGTALNATSSVPACATGAGYTPRYSFRVQIASGAWGAWTTWQTGAVYTRSGNTNATAYSFQVMVRCESSAQVGDSSVPSDSASVTYYTPPTAPATPSVTAALSGSNVVGTASAVTCSVGTLQYKIDSQVNDGAWSNAAWGSATTASLTATDGYKYAFRATARCVNGTQTATSGTGTSGAYVDPVANPSTPTITAVISGSNAVGTIGAIACPAGTTTLYTTSYIARAKSTTTTWTSWAAWTTSNSVSIAANQGWQYNFKAAVYCNGVYADSGTIYSSTNAVVVRSMSAPAAPEWAGDHDYFKSSTGSWKSTVSYTTSCPTGSSIASKTFDSYPEWSSDDHWKHSWPYEDWWNTSSSSTKYVKYYARYKCETDYASATSAEAYDRIPVKP